MYRLYSIPGSCSTGIHVLLNKLGQQVEVVNRDDVNNYHQLVPSNQVPALVDGEELLTEGAAITMHLLEKHGAAPLPGPEARSFRQWLLFNYATLHPAYSKLYMIGAHVALEHEESQRRLVAHVAERLSELWDIVETHLEGREFMVGEAPSIIDYLLAIYANWGNSFPEAGIRIGANTRRLITSVVKLPEFVEAIEREGVDYRMAA